MDWKILPREFKKNKKNVTNLLFKAEIFNKNCLIIFFFNKKFQ